MKHILAILLLLSFPIASYGACSGTISGKSKTVSLDISDGGCAYAAYYISFSKLGADGKTAVGGARQVPFNEECKEVKNGITCRPNGRTPLSGTTYRLEHFGRDPCDETGKTRGTRYRCVNGCNGDAPQFLEIEPYEC